MSERDRQETNQKREIMEFRAWDDLTEAEQLGNIFSDDYKDEYGFRPRFGTPEDSKSVEWLQAQIDKLRKE